MKNLFWPPQNIKSVHTSIDRHLIGLCWIFASVAAQASQSPCVPISFLEVNGVVYMGAAASVIEKLGKPLKTKSSLYESGGNSGNYFLKHYIYNGGTLTVRDEQQGASSVERWILTSPSFVMGGKIRIGQSKENVAALLDIKSDKEVLSVAEAKAIFAGGNPKISAAKSNWSLSSCTLYPESTFIEFHFNKSKRLAKIVVYHDDGAI